MFAEQIEQQTSQVSTAIIKGIIKRIIFQKDDFHILSFMAEKTKEPITIVGDFFNVAPEDDLTVWGEWESHPKFGHQLKVSKWERPLPSTMEQIEKYLASGHIKGIGPVKAARIVREFGERTLDVIQTGPDVLGNIKGINREQAQHIHQSIVERMEEQHLLLNLLHLGFSASMAKRAYKHFKSKTVDIVKTNPYRLTEVNLFGFHKADQIASHLGLPTDSSERIQAAILHVTEETTKSTGHCWLTRDETLEEALKLLNKNSNVSWESAEKELTYLSTLDSQLVQMGEQIYPGRLFRAESIVANRISSLASSVHTNRHFPLHRMIELYEKRSKIKLAQNQREAVEAIFQTNLLILTGGPGTGKTQTTRAIIDIFEQVNTNAKIVLSAPTGRASRRMSEVTGREAGTIHSLLKINKSGKPTYDTNNPLPCDLLVIDESSMLDISLARRVFEAISDDTKILLVGDIDQLPSVGPGNVLNDLINAGVPTVRLIEIFRQGKESQIVINAHRINQGKNIDIAVNKDDFFFIAKEDPEEIAHLILRSVRRLLQKGMTMEEIQVLCPMKKGPAGTTNLNRLIQSTVNPKIYGMHELASGNEVFRIGDKVIQTKNNYGKQVFNGDVGIVQNVGSFYDEDEGREVMSLTASFNGETVRYQENELGQLSLAYAVTVHKSQGSEYEAVIMPVTTQHYVMLARNLLYTAVTRAKKMVILVGTQKALHLAIRNNKISQRNTGLIHKIVTKG
ncbi:ATP-dependent RecD-like DNA helicase [Heliorestis acidaminivorans]|uniref:SF1B family DNA helicase RecD2 n=1 Tax=Heliorestis acidaminivorans TaxID=553427 RepID=UPI00147959F4|nr:ATP-dependent RecD-like DNA helicase [Heliorestis acidaminivorans]